MNYSRQRVAISRIDIWWRVVVYFYNRVLLWQRKHSHTLTGSIHFSDARTYKFWYHSDEEKIYWDHPKGRTRNIWTGKKHIAGKGHSIITLPSLGTLVLGRRSRVALIRTGVWMAGVIMTILKFYVSEKFFFEIRCIACLACPLFS